MDIPIELFALWIGISLAMVGLGFAFRPRIPLFIMLAGILIFPFVAITDNIIMGYSAGSSGLVLANTTSTTSANVTETVSEEIVFSDDYTTNTGWTQIGTLVTVDSGVADKVSFAWTTNNNQRVHKSLGTTILSSETFSIDWEYTYSAFNAGGNTASEPIIVLTAGTGDPLTAGQDMLGVGFRTSTNTGFNIMYKDDAGALTNCQIPNTMSSGAQYYMTFDRISLYTAVLYVYTDSARTSLLSGYPHSCSIPSTVGGFTHIQHGHNSALITTITANGDNVEIVRGQSELTIVLADGETVQYNYDDIGGTEGGALLFEFTEWPKIFFALYGSMLVFIGALVYQKEK